MIKKGCTKAVERKGLKKLFELKKASSSEEEYITCIWGGLNVRTRHVGVTAGQDPGRAEEQAGEVNKKAAGKQLLDN